MRAPSILRLFAPALSAWWHDDALRLGASLAYYALFAIAPVLLVATALAGMVFGEDAVRGELVGQLDQLVGRDGALAVQNLLDGASHQRPGILAAIVGAFTFLIAATGVFLELQATLNTIWRVERKPVTQLKAFFLDRVRSFGLVVAIGFLLMVSLAVTATLAAFSTWLAASAPAFPLVWSGVGMLVSFLTTTGLFALLFRVLPDVHLQWRDVTTGALVTAVLFTAGQQLIGLYLGGGSMATSYGAAGSVLILLLWVYYSCQILLFGAEFTRVYAERHTGTPVPVSFGEKEVTRASASRNSRVAHDERTWTTRRSGRARTLGSQEHL